MPIPDLSASPRPGELKQKQLAQADYGFSSPFLLTLAQHEQVLICEKVVRLIPKKRMVVFGYWNHQAIVAKIFFSRHAKQHLQRELQGVQALRRAKIPSPTLLHTDASPDKTIQLLIFERIENADNLENVWQKFKFSPESEIPLRALTIELATQHVLGLEQADLHLKNFLVTSEKIYTLDGSSIRTHDSSLSKKQSLENLALFFSQLGIHRHQLQYRLFQFYIHARGWLIKKSDLHFLQKAIRHWNNTRWLDYSKKIFRSSTPFAKIKNRRFFSLCDRAYLSPAFRQVLEQPDAVFAKTETVILKAGRTSTVACFQVDQHKLVIKRYNRKGFWHRLSLIFKRSRARLSWRLAHQLRFVGLPTAKPVAFIEKRFLGLGRETYFVMEYVEGLGAATFFDAQSAESKQGIAIAKRIITLFVNLARLRLSHGDLKITNILLNAKREPVLIDLDGMREHRSSRQLRQYFNKDLERFLENWQKKPDWHQLFQGLIRDMKRV